MKVEGGSRVRGRRLSRFREAGGCGSAPEPLVCPGFCPDLRRAQPLVFRLVRPFSPRLGLPEVGRVSPGDLH